MMAIFIAFTLMQIGAWVYLSRPKSVDFSGTLSITLFVGAAAIFSMEFGIETGLSFAVLLATMVMLINVLLQPEAKK